MLDLVIRLMLAWLCRLDDKTLLVDNSVQEILMTTPLGAVFYKDLFTKFQNQTIFFTKNHSPPNQVKWFAP